MSGADQVGWAALSAAYGSAERVPTLLAELRADAPDRRRAALEELSRTVWHQGTVYECSPRVVPVLVDVATDDSVDEETRTGSAFLLEELASAVSYVLPDRPTTMRVSAWRSGESEPDAGDLTVACRDAVAAEAPRLADALGDADGASRTALVAAVAAVVTERPELAGAVAEATAGDGDERVVAAGDVVLMLAENAVDEDELPRLAALDDDVADYLDGIADWPPEIRAVQLVRELCERVAWERLG